MKLKKKISFTDKNQIWRLLINSSDQLIIETRDTDKKEVFFHCVDLQSNKKKFTKLQMEEKYWIGIEVLYKNFIVFHLYAKPNMPEHKSIIVFDLDSEAIVWQNDDYAFLTLYEEKIYTFKRKFEGQDVFALNFNKGEIIKELGNDVNEIQPIINLAKSEEDFSNYKYPEQLSLLCKDEIKEIIENEVSALNNSDNIEFIEFDNFLIFNYYLKLDNNLFDNTFVIYNIEKKKKIISEVINKQQSSFTPDSFFMYKNFLLLLKNKNELITYKIS